MGGPKYTPDTKAEETEKAEPAAAPVVEPDPSVSEIDEVPVGESDTASE